MDVFSGIITVQAALECIKNIVDLAKSVKTSNLQIRENLVALQEKLLDTKDSMMALWEENQNLREQLKLKEEILHQKDGNILWRVTDREKIGPYCPACYGDQNKLISLNGNESEGWNCPKCRNSSVSAEWLRNHRQKTNSLGGL